MCGRYTLTHPEGALVRFGLAQEAVQELHPRFSIAPSQLVPVVLGGSDGRVLTRMRWGFLPGRVKPDPKHPALINARAETLAEKPLFKRALLRGRCVMLADGFYEWQVEPERGTRQPFYIRLRGGQVFGFAGIFTAPAKESDGRATCAIITTSASGHAVMAPIHQRMPVILQPAAEALWLETEVTDTALLLACLAPYPAEEMQAFPVSSLVNSPRNDYASLVEPIAC